MLVKSINYYCTVEAVVLVVLVLECQLQLQGGLLGPQCICFVRSCRNIYAPFADFFKGTRSDEGTGRYRTVTV